MSRINRLCTGTAHVLSRRSVWQFRTEVPRKSPDPLEKVVVLDKLFLERSGCRLIAAEMGTEATGSFTQQCRVSRDRCETLTDEAAA